MCKLLTYFWISYSLRISVFFCLFEGEGVSNPTAPPSRSATKYYSAQNKSPHFTLLRTVLALKVLRYYWYFLGFLWCFTYYILRVTSITLAITHFPSIVSVFLAKSSTPPHHNEIKTTPTALLFDLLQTFIKGLKVKLSFIVIAFIGDGSRSVMLCKYIEFG